LFVEQEGLRDKLCNLVETRLVNTPFAPIHITLYFRKETLTEQKLPNLVEKINEIVDTYANEIPSSKPLSIDVAPLSVRIISLMRFSTITKHSCKPIN